MRFSFLWSRLAGWLIAATVAGTVVFLLGWTPRLADSRQRDASLSLPPAILTVPASQLDLGLVQTGGHLEIPLDVTNRSAEHIDVSHFLTSCGCAGVEPPSIALGPGQTERVTLQMDLTHSWGPALAMGLSEIPFVARVTAEFAGSDGPSTETWHIRGRAIPYVTTMPRRLTFGRRSVLQPGFAPVKFRLTTQVPTKSVYAQVEGDDWYVRLLRTELPNEYAGELRAINRPLLGRHQIKVRLTLVGPDATPLPETVLRIDGEIVPDIEAYPSRLMLGGRPAGTTVDENILVESLSRRPIRLTRIESSSPALEATADFRETKSCHVVGVRRHIGSGSQEECLIVHFAVDGGREESIKVVVQAIGFELGL